MLKSPSQHYLNPLLTISTFLISDPNPVSGSADKPLFAVLPHYGASSISAEGGNPYILTRG